jgi:hypothetical protein
VGPLVGADVGPEVGPSVGAEVGEVGPEVELGPEVGSPVGAEVGPEVGPEVGSCDGQKLRSMGVHFNVTATTRPDMESYFMDIVSPAMPSKLLMRSSWLTFNMPSSVDFETSSPLPLLITSLFPASCVALLKSTLAL